MRTIWLLSLLLSLHAAPAATPTEAVAAFHEALATGNADAALARMAPDVVIFESGGAELSRDEYASHHLGGDMTFAAAVSREVLEQHEQTLGPDTALVLTRTRTTGTFNDREIDAAGVETMLLRRVEGDWRIVHVHWSSRSARR